MRTEYDLYHWEKDWAAPTIYRAFPTQADATVAAEAARGREGADPIDSLNLWRPAPSGSGLILTEDVEATFHREQQPFLIADRRVPETDAERVELALEVALEFGQTDGDHHKAWVIDQVVRLLTGDRYEQVITEYCAGADGPDTYEWDEGIAP